MVVAKTTDTRMSIGKDVRGVLNSMPVGIVLLSSYGSVIYTNHVVADWIGVDITGQRWRDVTARLFSELGGGYLLLCEQRTVSLATAPMTGTDRQVLVLSDVTEERKLSRRLEGYRRQNLMGNVAASLAHEIRTPVSSLLLLLSDLKTKTQEQNTLQVSNECIGLLEHLENLVRDMLSLAKGPLQNKSIFRLRELIEKYIETLPDSDRRIVFQDSSNNSHILGNPSLIRALIGNLVENAIASTDKDGEITLRMSDYDDRHLLLCVIDNGEGISPTSLTKIFEPFYTTKSVGTGLGLSIAKMIANEHGAVMSVDSDPKWGTAMMIKMPVVEPRDSLSDFEISHYINKENRL